MAEETRDIGVTFMLNLEALSPKEYSTIEDALEAGLVPVGRSVILARVRGEKVAPRPIKTGMWGDPLWVPEDAVAYVVGLGMSGKGITSHDEFLYPVVFFGEKVDYQRRYDYSGKGEK